MSKKALVLITGATGMIGSRLLSLLSADDRYDLLAPSRQELDLTQQLAVNEYFKSQTPQFVFHLAATVGGIHANAHYPVKFIYENTIMQCNVLNAAVKNGVKKLLFPGSACTYPKTAQQPIMESALFQGEVELTNKAYATAKLNGIVMCQSIMQEYGLSVVIPMPTNTYGIGDNFSTKSSHVIPALMARFHEARKHCQESVTLWGSGRPLREFIYVDDLVEAFIFLMEHYESPGIINVGTGAEISIRELAELIAQVVGYEGEIVLDQTKPDGVNRKCLDSKKINALGWKPKISLKEGIERMYNYHFNNEAAEDD